MTIQYQPEEEKLILPDIEKDKVPKYKCDPKKGNPYYTLDQETQKIVVGLLEKCIELKLGNVNFHYYYSPESRDEIDFFLSEYKDYWELDVRCRRKNTTDVYQIITNEIVYQYSEKD